MKNQIYLFLLLSALVLICPGCETLKKMEQDDALRKLRQGPQYAISVHKIVKFPRGQQLEKQVQTFSGRQIWINMNPFLHSKEITKIELVPRKTRKLAEGQDEYPEFNKVKEKKTDVVVVGEEKKVQVKKNSNFEILPGEKDEPKFYDLKLYFTRRGALAWMQISAGFRHQELAFLIDGIFYRTFIPTKLMTENEESAIIEGPFDETCAFLIAKNAQKNHKFFNKDKNPTKTFFDELFEN